MGCAAHTVCAVLVAALIMNTSPSLMQLPCIALLPAYSAACRAGELCSSISLLALEVATGVRLS